MDPSLRPFVLLAWLCGACRSPAPPAPPETGAPGGLAGPREVPQEVREAPLRLRDVAPEAGLDYRWSLPERPVYALPDTTGHGAAFLDFDLDGWADVLLSGPRPQLYRNAGGRFVRHPGLGQLPASDYFGVAVGDYDQDGYPDVYLSAFSGGRLLHNEAGRGFRDVTREAGVAEPGRWSSAATFADLDGDGRLDLLVSHYVRYEVTRRVLCNRYGIEFECPQSFPPDVPTAYRNLGGGRFADATARWGLGRSGGRTLGVATADLDGDGQVELVLANDMAPGDLFVRKGDVYENQGVASGTAYARGRLRSGMGVDVGDFDGDGRLDIVEMSFVWQGASLLRNVQGLIYRDVAYPTGVGEGTRRYVGFGSLFLDLDNDGWLDLFVTNGQVYKNAEQLYPGTTFAQPSVLLYNHRGRFYDLSRALAGRAGQPIVGRGLAAADYDQDGRLDLLVVDETGPVQLLRNETSPAGHWLSLRLRDRAGHDVQGVHLVAEIGARQRVAVAHNDGSYVSASEPRVHLGLGPATVVAAVVVHWPSGRKERFGPFPADRRAEVREGEGRPEAGP